MKVYQPCILPLAIPRHKNGQPHVVIVGLAVAPSLRMKSKQRLGVRCANKAMFSVLNHLIAKNGPILRRVYVKLEFYKRIFKIFMLVEKIEGHFFDRWPFGEI